MRFGYILTKLFQANINICKTVQKCRADAALAASDCSNDTGETFSHVPGNFSMDEQTSAAARPREEDEHETL